MKVLACILLSWFWTTTQSCTDSENVTSVVMPVEVYQIIHLIKLNASTHNIIGTVDLLRNIVQLPTGTICEYHSGHCHDDKISQNYTWDVSMFEEANGFCNLKHFSDANFFDFTYSIVTLNEEPLVKFLVVENSTLTFILELTLEETICAKNIWRTDHEDIVVAVDEENFIDAKEREILALQPAGIIFYDIERKQDMYSVMDLKCKGRVEQNAEQRIDTRSQIDCYKDELAQLRASVAALQTEVRAMQDKLDQYEKENEALKKHFGRQDLSHTSDYSGEFETVGNVDMNLERASLQEEVIEVLPQTFENTFDGLRNCPNFVLFPYENVFCILVAMLYVIFSVINTITNYFSLRMLRNKKQKNFVFYTLTSSLTTLYVSRCLNLTKRRIDKWLLDLE